MMILVSVVRGGVSLSFYFCIIDICSQNTFYVHKTEKGRNNTVLCTLLFCYFRTTHVKLHKNFSSATMTPPLLFTHSPLFYSIKSILHIFYTSFAHTTRMHSTIPGKRHHHSLLHPRDMGGGGTEIFGGVRIVSGVCGDGDATGTFDPSFSADQDAVQRQDWDEGFGQHRHNGRDCQF